MGGNGGDGTCLSPGGGGAPGPRWEPANLLLGQGAAAHLDQICFGLKVRQPPLPQGGHRGDHDGDAAAADLVGIGGEQLVQPVPNDRAPDAQEPKRSVPDAVLQGQTIGGSNNVLQGRGVQY